MLSISWRGLLLEGVGWARSGGEGPKDSSARTPESLSGHLPLLV